jgi:hypothetical protein
MAGIVAFAPGVPAFRASLATTYLELGRVDEARNLLCELVADDFEEIPRDWFFPLVVARVAELCVALDDAESAGRLWPWAAPYAGQLLVVSMGNLVDGAADRALAHLLAAQADVDGADQRYALAASLEDKVGASALAAQTRYWHAKLLARAGRDTRAARDLADRAVTAAREMGMRLLLEQATELHTALSSGPHVSGELR